MAEKSHAGCLPIDNFLLVCPSSQILFSCSSHPTSEDRTLYFHVDLVERIHDSLDPVLVHLPKKLFDCFFGLR